MATAKHIRKLIQSGAAGDYDAFRLIADEIIREERLKNHHLLANDLEKILYSTNREVSNRPQWKDVIPLDRERGLPLLTIQEPMRSMQDLIVSDENRSILEELLLEHHSVDRLATYGMKPSDRILFFGPPGTGKTLTAEVLATELGRNLAILKIDSVISSFLGETATNLRAIFDFISDHALVVLLDEFDAIGRERSDASEHGEIKRLVNAFLQMMDSYQGKSILIAATNHEADLDRAVWRRFDEVLRFENPNLEQIRKLLEIKLRGIRREFDTDDAQLTRSFKGMSHAGIERVLRRAIKDMILSGKEFLAAAHLESALMREETRKRAHRDG